MKKIIILNVILLILLSCSGAKVYNSDDINNVLANQKTIAIMPPRVDIIDNEYAVFNKSKDKEKESINLQREMYSWFLKRFSKNGVRQHIQDLETTNIKLKRAGYSENELTKEEVCDILGVDAVISSNYTMSKPMPELLAVVTSVLLDHEGKTNEISANINIYDNNFKKIFWNYENKYSGGWKISYSDLVDNLMRNASKNMPYGSKK